MTFVKRTTGELRQMTCRLNVTSRLKGGEKKFSDEEKGLLTVFSLDADDYRSISCESVRKVCIDGDVWEDTNV